MKKSGGYDNLGKGSEADSDDEGVVRFEKPKTSKGFSDEETRERVKGIVPPKEARSGSYDASVATKHAIGVIKTEDDKADEIVKAVESVDEDGEFEEYAEILRKKAERDMSAKTSERVREPVDTDSRGKGRPYPRERSPFEKPDSDEEKSSESFFAQVPRDAKYALFAVCSVFVIILVICVVLINAKSAEIDKLKAENAEVKNLQERNTSFSIRNGELEGEVAALKAENERLRASVSSVAQGGGPTTAPSPNENGAENGGENAADDPPAEVPTQTPEQTQQPTQSPPSVRIHTVAPGESLEAIAKYYYGTEDFSRILEANDDIDDPNIIIVGQKLIIP